MTSPSSERSIPAAPFAWRPSHPLTIEHAADAWRALAGPLGDGAGLDVDLSQVTKADTSGCQVLVMAQRACAQHGAPWRLQGAAPAVREVMQLLGVDERLADLATTDADMTPHEEHS